MRRRRDRPAAGTRVAGPDGIESCSSPRYRRKNDDDVARPRAPLLDRALSLALAGPESVVERSRDSPGRGPYGVEEVVVGPEERQRVLRRCGSPAHPVPGVVEEVHALQVEDVTVAIRQHHRERHPVHRFAREVDRRERQHGIDAVGVDRARGRRSRATRRPRLRGSGPCVPIVVMSTLPTNRSPNGSPPVGRPRSATGRGAPRAARHAAACPCRRGGCPSTLTPFALTETTT